MLKVILNAFILFTFISPCLTTSGGRKYDVETEAMKLYGEDFKSVLRRFRRTPDYLKILTDKMDDLKVYVKEMSLQVLNYINTKMVQRVNDLVGVTRFDEVTTTLAPMYYHAYNRRQDDPVEPGDPSEPTEPGEPEPGEENDEKHLEDVRKLDNYKMFDHALTTQERNSFRDVGFEFAGQLIHAIIRNMGPVETSNGPKSTRLPFGGQESDKSIPTTTEHPHTHEVTAESTVGETHSPDEEVDTTPETFRFRKGIIPSTIKHKHHHH